MKPEITPKNIGKFLARVNILVENGCWYWSAGKCGTPSVYGKFNPTRHSGTPAHRFSYEVFVGPIPPKMQIDHICAEPLCVNPFHLRVCTARENIFSPYTLHPMRLHAEKTHCLRGHEFTPENTYIQPSKPTGRLCRICKKLHAAKAWKERSQVV